MRKPGKKLTMLFLIINVILMISVLATFWFYLNKSQNKYFEDSVAGMKVDSSNVSQQFYRYLLQQENIVKSLASYIEEADLNQEEMMSYLRYQRSLIGDLRVVNADDSQKYQAGAEGQQLQMTEPFEENGRKVVAFYQTLKVEDENLLLLHVEEISRMTEEGMEDIMLFYGPGVLMESSGEVLSNMDKEGGSQKYTNYYEYMEEQYGGQQRKEVEEQINAANEGVFTVTNDIGQERLFIFTKIGDTDGWVYVSGQEHVDMRLDSNAVPTTVILIIFMTFMLSLNAGVIFWHNSKLKKSLVIIEDRNQKLEIAVQEAEMANEAKSSFLSNMSHEIRTPINAVLGLDEMILRESEEEAIRSYALDIKNAGNILLGLVNDVLDFSKIESGKMEIIPVEYELGSVVNDLCNMIGIKAEDKGLELIINVNPETPHLLYGDEIRMKQIILNILTNAVKYTERGKVTFSLDYRKIDEESVELNVSVKDTGIGMKQEELDRLYTPFERMDEKRNRTIEGTGLGMSIVQRLLGLMDSQLQVQSVYGEGSEFSFHIVQKVVDWRGAGKLEQLYQEAYSGQQVYRESFRAADAEILVVDDTAVNLTVVKGLLKQTRVKVDTAESGLECLEMIQQKKYHIIFLDHRMPGMDGVETLHRIRETEHKNTDTPVIALTANALSGARESYINEGFQDFLSKPVNAGKLEKMVRKYLPEELIELVEEAEEPIEQENMLDAPEFVKLEAIPEISPAKGVEASGSPEIYLKVLSDFVDAQETRCREIQEFYDAGDVPNYVIKVHALKSAARLAGALELSKWAEKLEHCGNQGDVETIQSETGELLKAYKSLKEKLLTVFDKPQEESKPFIAKEALEEALAAVKEFTEAFDFDNVDGVMEQLDTYQMPEEFQTEYQQLKQLVMDVAQQEIIELITGYLGGNNNG